jgi:hypothetical protein
MIKFRYVPMNPQQLAVFNLWANKLNITITAELLKLANQYARHWAVHQNSLGTWTTIHRVPSKNPLSPIFRIIALSRTFVLGLDGKPELVGLPQFSDITELDPEFWASIADIPLSDPRVKGLRKKEDGEFITVCLANLSWSSKRGPMNPKFLGAAKLCFKYIEDNNLDHELCYLFEFVKPGGAVAYDCDRVVHIGTCDPETLTVTLPAESNVISSFTSVETIADVVERVKGIEGCEGYVLELNIDGVTVLLKLKTLWWRKKHCDSNIDPIWSMILELQTGGRFSLDNVLWAARNPQLMSTLADIVPEFLRSRAQETKAAVLAFREADGRAKGVIGSQAKEHVSFFAHTLSAIKDMPLTPGELTDVEFVEFLELLKKRISLFVQECKCNVCKAGNKHRCYPTKAQDLITKIWAAVPGNRRDYCCTYTR